MKLFGTDGIRFIYSQKENATAYSLGYALATLAPVKSPVIVVGRDTRQSGNDLSSAFMGGVADGGATPVNVGILPTDAVSFFVRSLGADWGVMISASHNSPEYNGLKVFDGRGFKADERTGAVIEKVMSKNRYCVFPEISVKEVKNARKIYVERLLSKASRLDGLKILIDCAHGSASGISGEVFEKVGAEVTVVNGDGNGNLINDGCGAACPESADGLSVNDSDLTFLYDGDADRLVVFEKERLLGGDRLFYIFAKYLQEKEKLGDKAVGTILTNGGVERALNAHGISLIRSKVGDGNVHRLMRKTKSLFGGENSGHFMNFHLTKTSDAIANSLFLVQIKKEKGSLFSYSEELFEFPSVSVNLPVTEGSSLSVSRLKEKSLRLYPEVKTVIRMSGTEPLLRIYAESERLRKDELEEICLRLREEAKE